MSLAGRVDLLAADVGAQVKALRTEVRSPTKYRAFRPQLLALGPGVDSVVEARYWFDGTEMNYELSIQNAATGAGFVGNNPAFLLPSRAANLDRYWLRVIGDGHIHDATSGLLYNAKVVRVSATHGGLYYTTGSVATQLSPVQTSGGAPISWKILDGFYLKGSYIPEVPFMPQNYVVYGDSITRFENTAGQIGDIGWAPQVQTEALRFGGGFARDGGTSAVALANAKALSADIGISQLGVNDIAQGVTQSTTLANIQALATKVGADKWMLLKIPPYDANPNAVISLNNAYQALATNKGWYITDPWAAYRNANGTWVTGASYDGTHPNAGPVAAAALNIRAAVTAALA